MLATTDVNITETADFENRRVLFDFPQDVDTHPFWAFVKALGLDEYIVEDDDSWLDDPKVMESIRRGEQDIAEGRGKFMTSSEIRTLLGV